MFTARHRSLPPTRTEHWTIEDRPRRLVRPIGIRKALGCRQAGRVQRGPPQSGPGRPARILAELRKCLRARYVGTRDADTITRIYSFGIGQSPAWPASAMASGTGIGPPGANGAMGRTRPSLRSIWMAQEGGWVADICFFGPRGRGDQSLRQRVAGQAGQSCARQHFPVRPRLRHIAHTNPQNMCCAW